MRTRVDLREFGFPGYDVSSGGTITSQRSGGPLRGYAVRGRIFVHLRACDGRRRSIAVGRLVAAAFLGPPPFAGARLLYRRPSAVAAADLRWGTRKDHARRGGRHPHARLTLKDVRAIRTARARGVKLDELAGRFGVSRTAIWAVAAGRNWKHVTTPKGNR